MSQSLDGYVDHLEMQPGPALFRHFIDQVRDLTGSVITSHRPEPNIEIAARLTKTSPGPGPTFPHRKLGHSPQNFAAESVSRLFRLTYSCYSLACASKDRLPLFHVALNHSQCRTKSRSSVRAAQGHAKCWSSMRATETRSYLPSSVLPSGRSTVQAPTIGRQAQPWVGNLLVDDGHTRVSARRFGTGRMQPGPCVKDCGQDAYRPTGTAISPNECGT